MLRKDLTKLEKREDITPDSFEMLGILLSGYTAGEAAVNALVSPVGQGLLRNEHLTEGCSERSGRSYERQDRRFGGAYCTSGRSRSHSAYLAGLLPSTGF